MPIFNGPPKRSVVDTSRGVHIRALHAALAELEQIAPRGPRREAIAVTRQRLVKAYPGELAVTDTDIEQMLAEEDGDAVQDEGP